MKTHHEGKLRLELLDHNGLPLTWIPGLDYIDRVGEIKFVIGDRELISINTSSINADIVYQVADWIKPFIGKYVRLTLNELVDPEVY